MVHFWRPLNDSMKSGLGWATMVALDNFGLAERLPGMDSFQGMTMVP